MAVKLPQSSFWAKNFSMSTCVLHIGMPKTGTSSIQDSLYLALADPGFRYIQLDGNANAGTSLQTLFSDEPCNNWVYKRKGLGSRHVQRLKRRYDNRLKRSFRLISTSKTAGILSAENCWHFKTTELQSIRDYMESQDVKAKIIVYLRPFKSWIESAFQQNVKFSRGFTTLDKLNGEFAQARLNYVERLENFERIFGGDNLIVRPYIREDLKGGCAVQDFCAVLGIEFKEASIQRTNEALCADAVRMLYCFNQFSRHTKLPSLIATDLLLMKLAELVGRPFRLHSDLIAPLHDHIDAQNQAILHRYGVDLRENIQAADGDDCIRKELDLMRFSRSSLDWLSRTTGGNLLLEAEGVDTGQAVSDRVALLVRRPRTMLLWKYLRRKLQFKFHGFLYGN